MTGLTSEDLSVLQERKLARIIDFRGPKEVAFAPDKVPPGTLHTIVSAGSVNYDPDDCASMVNDMKTQSLENADKGVLNYYKNVSAFTDRYRPLFQQLLDLPIDSALVFHCVGGKDRTRVAAALIEYVFPEFKAVFVHL